MHFYTPTLTTALPASLYRYQRFTPWLKAVIVDCELYFPLIGELNDPCEVCYRVDTTWDDEMARAQLKAIVGLPAASEAVERANPGMDVQRMHQQMRSMPFEQLFELAKRGHASQTDQEREAMLRAQLRIDATTIGVCCFTELAASGYMSYHYAGGHTGVCLELATDALPFSAARPVKYVPEPPVLRLISADKTAQYERMLTKSPEWQQEREWRLINQRIVDGRVHRFEAAALKSISLCSEFRDENLPQLREWLEQHREKWSRQLPVYRLRRRQESYRLDRVPVDL